MHVRQSFWVALVAASVVIGGGAQRASALPDFTQTAMIDEDDGFSGV